MRSWILVGLAVLFLLGGGYAQSQTNSPKTSADTSPLSVTSIVDALRNAGY